MPESYYTPGSTFFLEPDLDSWCKSTKKVSLLLGASKAWHQIQLRLVFSLLRDSEQNRVRKRLTVPTKWGALVSLTALFRRVMRIVCLILLQLPDTIHIESIVGASVEKPVDIHTKNVEQTCGVF